MGKASTKAWVNALGSFNQKLANTIFFICTILFIGVMVVIFIAVIGRFLLHFSTPWSEEFTRFSFIALSFLGMGAALAMNEHIEIDVFTALANKIKNIEKKWLFYKIDDLFRYLFLGGLGSFLMYMYFDYTIKQQKMNQISAGLQLPMWILYVALTAGFALLVIHCVINIIMIIGDYETVRSRDSLKGENE